MPRPSQRPTAARRRTYDQYCAAARALDAVGDRWTLLIVRELLAGPRRYTDLHADLPGVSTDMLAGRLKDMERDGLATRRRLPPPSPASVYELTPRGRSLLPLLRELARWGADALDAPRATDAVRAHWFAVPLLDALDPAGKTGEETVVEVHIDEGVFHLAVAGPGDPSYGDGPAEHPHVRLRMDTATCAAVSRGDLTVADGVKTGRVDVEGAGPAAAALRGETGHG
ncbi:transcriptional regulator [Streptomyces sp. CC53]|uniref:winged helix-turn-helix transcriptional regulator n=1 Tax=unclassified Streptomyces TaxID=2593676 RepID=UPI0008DE4A9B|nr:MULTISPECIES: helix-turn-helix domain-containing protein [unclassified Streptomyces]OII62419.1 transcriptional regulator [Streptomyces sp. CC53]